VPGLFEVVVDGELVYTDSSGRYAFVGGALMDMKERKDLTAAHNEKRMSIPRQAPAAAGHQGSAGDGSKVFAVFEDPNCPICRVFTKFIDQLDNVTVYRFMFPVISPQSQNLARMAWCSSDRAGVWKAMMQGARPQLSESCDNSGLIKILATGERFQINNTPTVVLANGKRLVGATLQNSSWRSSIKALNAGAQMKVAVVALAMASSLAAHAQSQDSRGAWKVMHEAVLTVLACPRLRRKKSVTS
jgi:thiol:disulfide interchange protein DsbC